MSRAIRLMATIFVTITVISSIINGIVTRSHRDAAQSENQLTAQSLQKNKCWDEQDYLRYCALGSVLSDRDFDWLVSELKGNLPPNCNPAVVDPFIVGQFLDSNFTSRQEAVAKQAVLPLLSSHDPADASDVVPENACEFFEQYHDDAAIPQLLLLVNSPHNFVRYHAARALNSMGDKIAVPPRPLTAT